MDADPGGSVVLTAGDVSLPVILAHIEAGRVVIIVPPVSPESP